MRIAVIGALGQLGSELMAAIEQTEHDAIGLTHDDIQVESQTSVNQALGAASPDVVINTAAFHKVDDCEKDPEKTFSINTWGAANVARWCSLHESVNALISTDYVFAGEHLNPYGEEDPMGPRMVYGVSKAAAETLTAQFAPMNYVFRVSAVFGIKGASGKGGNFVETVLRLASERDELAFIDDMHTAVTYAPHAARFIV